jgi:hypothetical protein
MLPHYHDHVNIFKTKTLNKFIQALHTQQGKSAHYTVCSELEVGLSTRQSVARVMRLFSLFLPSNYSNHAPCLSCCYLPSPMAHDACYDQVGRGGGVGWKGRAVGLWSNQGKISMATSQEFTSHSVSRRLQQTRGSRDTHHSESWHCYELQSLL